MKGFKNISNISILVDFSNQVFRSYHATKNETTVNTDGINVGCVIGLIKVLRQAINKANQFGSLPNLIICEDRKPTRKRSLYKKYHKDFLEYKQDKAWDGEDIENRISYKGNRIKDDIGFDPISICSQFLNCIPCTKIWCDGEEADDVIASYIHNHKKDKIFCYSTDKDLWQLLDVYENLEIILGDNNSPTVELCEKHFNTQSFSKIALHKIIRGDSGDNVKSILRFPFKKNLDVYEKSDTITEYISGIIKKHGKDSKEVLLLKKFKNIIKLNKELVKLKLDLKYEMKHITEPDHNNWRKLCMMYEIPSLLNSPMLKIF